MPELPPHLADRLAAEMQQTDLLDRWIQEQLSAPDQRLDLIDPATLKAQSQDLLSSLAATLPSAAGRPLDHEAWHPVRQELDEICRSRDVSGFSSSEAAAFVLSLKRPLLGRLDEGDLETEDFWKVHDLLDLLGLRITEIYQHRREETIARQRREMEELSTPVIKVWDGIVAMPLIGTLDTHRSQMVTETLLDALSKTGAEIAVLDLTGVPAVDTRMAQHLMRTVAAARLMGADCILCGIRPQIAQTIVHLQINLGNIVTEGSLASALRTAFKRMGLRISTGGEQ